MATASADNAAKRHPLAATIVLSIVGYAAVVGTFLGVVPRSLFPELSLTAVNRLADAIALVNAVNVLVIAAGWRWIRKDEVKKHATAMVTSFVLILVFLVMYLTKIGGGGTKEFVGPNIVYYPYLAMLAIHIVLSIVAVPVVLYALVLGATHSPAELRTETRHRTVGRIAAGSWLLSLTLGVVTYLLLNHAFDWEYVEAAAATLLLVG
jgi:putative membrane protein